MIMVNVVKEIYKTKSTLLYVAIYLFKKVVKTTRNC